MYLKTLNGELLQLDFFSSHKYEPAYGCSKIPAGFFFLASVYKHDMFMLSFLTVKHVDSSSDNMSAVSLLPPR